MLSATGLSLDPVTSVAALAWKKQRPSRCWSVKKKISECGVYTAYATSTTETEKVNRLLMFLDFQHILFYSTAHIRKHDRIWPFFLHRSGSMFLKSSSQSLWLDYSSCVVCACRHHKRQRNTENSSLRAAIHVAETQVNDIAEKLSIIAEKKIIKMIQNKTIKWAAYGITC